MTLDTLYRTKGTFFMHIAEIPKNDQITLLQECSSSLPLLRGLSFAAAIPQESTCLALRSTGLIIEVASHSFNLIVYKLNLGCLLTADLLNEDSICPQFCL
jgi:hypothetical protein